MKKLTIEFVRNEFEKRGFKLISDKYVGAHQKLEYICSEGHKGEKSYGHFKEGRGCRICANNKMKHSIEFIKEEFEKRGCKLISTEYTNGKQKLEYICKNGHKHGICYNDFGQGYGCCYCANNIKHNIEFIREEFKKRGYQLLSTEYINSQQKLEYICPKGHHCDISYISFYRGRGCNICAINSRGLKLRHDIEFIREEFKKRGCKLISTEYVGANEKLDYICKNGHKHSVRYGNLQSGRSCPYCSFFKSEQLTREIFEKIYEEKFPKKRPSFLKYNKGRNLELDGYCEKLNIAFEYQGQQHYEYTEYFHRTESDFKNQKERDEWKYTKCNENDIILILIPYHFNYQNPEKLEQYIREQLITHSQL